MACDKYLTLYNYRNAPLADERPTAMVLWIIGCLSFIGMAILEYAWILNHMYNNHKVVGQNDKQPQEDIGQRTRHKVDRSMLVIFPVVFAIFSLVFWIYTATAGQ